MTEKNGMTNTGEPEKLCPEYAEPIKLAARTCKHCGHKLTDLERSQPRIVRTERETRDLDRVLKNAYDGSLRYSDIPGSHIEKYRIAEECEESGVPMESVLQRAQEIGVILGDKPAPLPRAQYPMAYLLGREWPKR